MATRNALDGNEPSSDAGPAEFVAMMGLPKGLSPARSDIAEVEIEQIMRANDHRAHVDDAALVFLDRK
jgi:hypothetical protein